MYEALTLNTGGSGGSDLLSLIENDQQFDLQRIVDSLSVSGGEGAIELEHVVSITHKIFSDYVL